MNRTVVFFFFWLIVIHLFAWFAFNRLYLTEPDKSQFFKGESFPKPPSLDFLEMHARWDSDWYIEIAAGGYSYNLGEKAQSNIVFFPLYPLSIRILGERIRAVFPQFNLYASYVLAGTTISILTLLMAVIFLFKLLNFDFDEKTSSRVIINLLIFPTSFFFVAVYSESLFLALSVLAFYFTRKNRWISASIFGAFASLTKPIGVLLLIPMLVEFAKQQRRKAVKKNALLATSFLLIPLAVGFFALYLNNRFDDPLAFVHAQKAFGRLSPLDSLSNPLVLIKSLRSHLVFAFGFTRASLTNILSVLFPLFILPSIWGKNEIFRNIYSFSSVLFLGLNIILFVNGYWAG